MKWNLMAALALSAGISGQTYAGNHYDREGYGRYDNYTFSCTSKVIIHRGEEVITHTIAVDGEIDANRRTLGGEPVFVSVNDRGFAKYNLPQHSIWIKDGELISLSLRGQTVKGEVFKFRYAGEGNTAQNRIELSKNRRTLGSDDISCTLSKNEW